MSPDPSISLRDFFRLLFKRKGLILLFFFSTVATVGGASWLFDKPRFEATAQLLLQPGREHVSDLSLATGGALAPRISFDLEGEASQAIEMLTGRSLAEQVVKSLGPRLIYPDIDESPRPLLGGLFGKTAQLDEQSLIDSAVGKLQENVHAELVGRSPLINLSFRHGDPRIAAKVVERLTNFYLDRYLGIHKNARVDAFFEEQFRLLKGKLSKAESDLERFKAKYNITSSVKDEEEAALRQLTSLQAQMRDTEGGEAETGRRIEVMHGQLSDTAKTPEMITATRDQLIALELKETELALRYTDQNPALKSLRREIGTVRDKLASMQDKPYGNSASKDGSFYAQRQELILHDQAQLEALHARKAAQQVKSADLRKKVDQLEFIEPEFNRLQQQVQVEQQNYRLYLAKSEEARISNAMDAEKISSVKLIEAAKPPLHPLRSKFALKMALAVLFGALGGVGLAFLLQLIGGRLETPEDVERVLQVPVLGSIPVFRPV